jgi:TonB family protein
MRSSAFLLLTLSAFAQAPEQEPTTAKEWLNRGVQLFKSASYSEAIAAFERVVQLDPGLVNGHLYLATANLSQFRPGDESAANLDFARRTESALNSALAIDSRNMVALKTMASLKYNQTQGVKIPAQKISALDEAERWYRRILVVDNLDKEALYSIGVIAWSKAYPESQQARASIGMRREDPGPIRDANVRLEFRNRTARTVEEGMSSLQKAIEIDPQYDDAMAYLNLLYRQLADGVDTPEEYRKNIADADLWVQRALETKKAKAAAGIPPNRNMVAAPPPPPAGPSPQLLPGQIRVGGNIQAEKLIEKPIPPYPPLAKQARIQGVVRFNAVIGRDGTVVNLTLVSGHPLFVPNATEAVRQWKYQPTLLNGQPVEVVTQIDVSFTLTE